MKSGKSDSVLKSEPAWNIQLYLRIATLISPNDHVIFQNLLKSPIFLGTNFQNKEKSVM